MTTRIKIFPLPLGEGRVRGPRQSVCIRSARTRRPQAPSPQPSPGGRGSRAFTLIELLVVIGVITILATLTVVAVNAVSREARLSGGVNTVIAALGQARALAMKNNKPVLVVFRANWDPENPDRRQFTEIVTAQWTGEMFRRTLGPQVRLIERYSAIPDAAVRELPVGIKVAGPWYDFATLMGNPNFDQYWVTQPESRRTNPQLSSPETEGRMIGVMFAPDGSMVTRSPNSAGINTFAYVDFNNDYHDPPPGLAPEVADPDIGMTTAGGLNPYWFYDEAADEPFVNLVPFLAVYDDDQAREFGNPVTWTSATAYESELTGPEGFINKNANRIHFNRYSGVVMTTKGEGG